MVHRAAVTSAIRSLTGVAASAAGSSASAKAIVMFGDAPAHDPVCAALTGLDHDVTEASVTERLQAAGITLIVVSVDGGMDGDPTASAGDYQPTCPTIGGTSGQGSRMAAATGGTYTIITDAAELVPAVLAAVQAVNVEVSLRADCPAPLQVTFTPAVRTVASGAVAEFTETFSAPAEASSATITCTTSMLINGEPVAGAVETNEITIEGQAPRYTG